MPDPIKPRPRFEDVVGVPAEVNYRYSFLAGFDADSLATRCKERITEWPD